MARRIRVPLGFAFAVVYVWFADPSKASIALGACFVIPGLLLRAIASGHVQKNEELTTSGPYAHTRNPLYLGSLVLAGGFAIAARNGWLALMMVLIFIAIYVPVILAEEQFLRRTFPSYEDYARQVPRLLPRWRGVGKESGRFSAQLYRKHREYNALIGSGILMFILALKVLKPLW